MSQADRVEGVPPRISVIVPALDEEALAESIATIVKGRP
jgi:glycosyltransferase involved in cell wall biosynthesis